MFAKLFTTPGNSQVLATLDYDIDTDQKKISIRTDIKNLQSDLVLEYQDNDETEKAFNDFDETKALELRERLVALIT